MSNCHRETIALITKLGDRKVRVGGNRFAVSVSTARRAELLRLGVAYDHIERMRNVIAVIRDADGAVNTVGPRSRR